MRNIVMAMCFVALASTVRAQTPAPVQDAQDGGPIVAGQLVPPAPSGPRPTYFPPPRPFVPPQAPPPVIPSFPRTVPSFVPPPSPSSQQAPLTQAPPVARTVSLAGPRFGVSVLSEGVVEKLHEKEIDVSSTISQFGWQFERQFYGQQGGITALNEWVGLLGGLDQGVVIPSLTWLVGLRTPAGAEFGIGPNFTPAGVALALAAGVTIRAGILNVPMNFAMVPTKAGVRATLMTGFTLRSF